MNLIAEGHAIDELHRDVVSAIVFANFKYLCNVGMTERGGRFRFTNESLHPIAIRSDVGGKNLQRYFAVEPRVLGEVHLTHPTRTEFGDDTVMRQRCIGVKGFGHWVISCLGEIWASSECVIRVINWKD